MWYKDMFKEMEKLSDAVQAKKMGKYMQNMFRFIGIPKPKLSVFMKPYLKESKKYDFSWDFIKDCWKYDCREAQYIAIAYLMQNTKYLTKEDLPTLKELITTKSWWETVDSLDSCVGEIVIKNKELESVMLEWSKADNMWLRRVSIDYQQRFKEDTNKELLSKIIVNNLNSPEFFINKAIGWSLREYSKTNQKWVKQFIGEHRKDMANLSIKEGSKYLN